MHLACSACHLGELGKDSCSQANHQMNLKSDRIAVLAVREELLCLLESLVLCQDAIIKISVTASKMSIHSPNEASVFLYTMEISLSGGLSYSWGKYFEILR